MSRPPSDSRTLAVPAGRMTRFSRLGTMTAGVAGNMALNGLSALGRGERPEFRNLLMTPQNISRIANRLAEMRGAAMKIGQLVSMDTGEMLPPELAQIMARLRDDAHFMPPTQLKQVLNTNWREGWLKEFKHFNVRPIAAASIGQVHRAVLKDGRDMAIKVQYPGVAQSIDSDVANVGALIRISGLLPKGFDLAPYLDEARQQLHDETDYPGEGQFLKTFRGILTGDGRFRLPELYDDWTTQGILSMSFADGRPVEEAVALPQETRDHIASALVDLVLKELFEFGLMQTDPNFANYRYCADTGQIILLDFGATRRIGKDVSGNYRQLLSAGAKNDIDEMRRVSIRIGFFRKDTKARHQEKILGMMAMVFESMKATGSFDFARSDLSRRMQREGMELAESGFVPPPVPIDVLFIQRKFGGVFLLATRLKARVDVAGLFARYL